MFVVLRAKAMFRHAYRINQIKTILAECVRGNIAKLLYRGQSLFVVLRAKAGYTVAIESSIELL